jgi:predicted nucleotidyltransferase/uncharacterized protein with HEPN domain
MPQQAVKAKPLTRDEATRLLKAREAAIRAQGVTRLAVFGSTARNEAPPDSDVDVLVDIDWRRKFSLFDWAGLELFMRDLLGREVEVAMRRSLKPFAKDAMLAESVEVSPELGRRSNDDEGIDMPAHKARRHLRDIIDAIAAIDTFVAGKSYNDYLAPALLRRDVERDIRIICEAPRRIPADLLARHPQIPRHRFAAIRSILRHARAGASPDLRFPGLVPQPKARPCDLAVHEPGRLCRLTPSAQSVGRVRSGLTSNY